MSTPQHKGTDAERLQWAIEQVKKPEKRYMVVSPADQVEFAQQLVGKAYECLSLESAKNGRLAEITGFPLVFWPAKEDVPTATAWGREFASGGEVKLINVTIAYCPTPEEAVKMEWKYNDFIAHVTGKAENSTNLVEVLQYEPDTIPNEAADDAAPIAPPPRFPSAGSPLADFPASDGGASDEIPPLEAYQEAQGPLSAEAAYIPYTDPENAAVGGSGWPEPLDFWTAPKPPEMRGEWMPEALADLFTHEAETWGADPGIFGMFGIGICAGALPNYIKLQVKDGDANWLKAARLWLAVNGRSGSNKSPILVAMARGLEDLQVKLMAEVAYLQKKHKTDQEIYEKQRQMYISARAKGEAAEEPVEPEAPAKNRLIIKNATIEAYGDILASQGERGILGIIDELISEVTAANQYKRGGSDMEEMLRLRDGGRHSIDRKGVVTMIAEYGAAKVGGTQPDRIRKAVERADLTSNGYLQRWLFYNAREATLDLDRPAHPDYSRMTDIVERLYHLQHSGPVQFSDGAKRVRLEFREWAHHARSHDFISDALRSHISKWPDMFAELSLVYHAIECADHHNAFIAPEIPEATAERVSGLMRHCLFPHAKHFYEEIIDTASDTMKDARYLADKILAKELHSIDLTWIAQGWTKWRTFKPWQKKSILTLLGESGWLRSKDPRGYVDGMTYSAKVNPTVHVQFSAYAEIERARLEDMEERRQAKMLNS